MRLNGNICDDYIRVRVDHDIQQPLTKFVSIVRAKERQVCMVHYENLARFCKVCGLVGHDYKECGLGINDEKKLKYGDWIYDDAPSRSRSDVAPVKDKSPTSSSSSSKSLKLSKDSEKNEISAASPEEDRRTQ
ncbi:hypothetical protein D1007_05153 [Hordeum vulgare]|nr:hypothetical protein D1007_05153 [Hordeum vulgare]